MKSGRVSTGIYCLDDFLGGGYRENTVNIVQGTTGVGKTIFALQYSLFGLDQDEKVIYVSFEMSEEQIIRYCRDMGWGEIEDYIEQGNLKIIQLFGEDLTFPSLDIAEMIKHSMSSSNIRIVIDPLTYPTFYSEKEKRKSLSTIFQELRKLGTAVITLEDDLYSNQMYEAAMILHLADTVIHLGFGEMYDRKLRIMKHTGSKHGEDIYPYSIETGMGIVLKTSEKQLEKTKPKTKYDNQFKEAIKKTKIMGLLVSARIEALQKNWTIDEDPSQVLDLIIKEERKRVKRR